MKFLNFDLIPLKLKYSSLRVLNKINFFKAKIAISISFEFNLNEQCGSIQLKQQ
jgi:hypothetical protein